MASLAGPEARCRCWCASVCRDRINALSGFASALPAVKRMTPSPLHAPPRPPGASARYLQPTSSDVDPLQLGARKEPDGAPVRRPERIDRALRASQRTGRRLVETAHPPFRRAIRGGREDEMHTVERERERCQVGRGRRGHLEPHERHRRDGPVPGPDCSGDDGDRGNCSQQPRDAFASRDLLEIAIGTAAVSAAVNSSPESSVCCKSASWFRRSFALCVRCSGSLARHRRTMTARSRASPDSAP